MTTILLNVLTVGAAFGFATVVFQHGVGTGLLGIDHQQFVDARAPLFFFALLFGLSMDYQLFLLAAIRGRYEATGDTRTAIQEGSARTGRPITSAALVTIVVFIAFGVTGPIRLPSWGSPWPWPSASTPPLSGSCSSPPSWPSSANATGNWPPPYSRRWQAPVPRACSNVSVSIARRHSPSPSSGPGVVPAGFSIGVTVVSELAQHPGAVNNAQSR